MTIDSSLAQKPRAWTTDAVVGLLSTIWGSTYFVIRAGLEHLPPFTSAAVRFTIACAIMTVLARLLASREGGDRPPWSLSLTMGLLNFGISYGIVYWSETILPSGLVSVLWAVFPMMMAVCGHLFVPGERLRPRQWLGFLVGFGGMVLLFSTDVAAVGPQAIPAGLVLLLSPLLSALGQTQIKRHGAGVSSLLLNRNAMAIGALVLAGAALIGERDAPAQWTTQAVASVLYLAVIGTSVTFGLYYWALRYAPAYRMSLTSYLSPVLALTVGAVAGGEPVGPETIAGVALILAGVGLVMLKHKRPAAPAAPGTPSPGDVTP
uniref:Transmembrane protein n=1 Tax=Kofleria flava TaxID=694315 RepID=A0A3S5GXL9_9BACT|nr:transmembrane protein [Kofleria flava]